MGTLTVNSSYSEGQTITVQWSNYIGPGLGALQSSVTFYLSGLNGLDISKDVNATSARVSALYSNITGYTTATATFNILNDQLTEGTEYFVVSLGADSKTFAVLDTSLTPTPTPTPITYTLSGNSSMNEGDTDYIVLHTTGIAPGTLINYTISGIAASRVSQIGYPMSSSPPAPISSINNYVTINNFGDATINFQVLNNNNTDGLTNAVINVANGGASFNVTVNDTSKSPISLSGSVSDFFTNLSKISDNSFTINEYPGTIFSNLDSLVSNSNKISSINAIGIPPGLTWGPNPLMLSQLINGIGVINKINGSSVLLNISDTSFNVASNIDFLQSYIAKIANIALQDPSPLVITAAQLAHDRGVLDLIGGFNKLAVTGLSVSDFSTNVANGQIAVMSLSDTAANLVSNLDLLQANLSKISSINQVAAITVTDHSPLLVSSAQLTSDAGILARIQESGGSYSVQQNTKTPVLIGINSVYSALPNQAITGSSGIEKIVFNEPFSNFKINISGSIATTVDSAGSNGTNTLTNIERLKFTDTNIAIDVGPTQNAGSVYMLYKAAFNRVPDTGGMGYWLAKKDAGKNIVTDLAQGFVGSKEFTDKYGTNPTNASYIDKLYQNVLGRNGDSGGIAYWNQELDAGRISKAAALVAFATLPEGASNVASLIANGIPYTEFVG